MGERRAAFAAVRSACELEIAGRRLRLTAARSFTERLVGLLWADASTPPCALLFEDCRSVHTLGMRVPIAVIGITGACAQKEGAVAFMVTESFVMQPGCVHRFNAQTRHVIEIVGMSGEELCAPGTRVWITACEEASL